LIQITLQKLSFINTNKFRQFKWAVVRGLPALLTCSALAPAPAPSPAVHHLSCTIAPLYNQCTSASLHPCIPTTQHLSTSASPYLYLCTLYYLCTSAPCHLCTPPHQHLCAWCSAPPLHSAPLMRTDQNSCPEFGLIH